MIYFKWMSIILGVFMIVGTIVMRLWPKAYTDWVEKKAYPENRHPWVVWVSVGYLFLGIFTWYLHVTLSVPYSILVTLVMTMGMVKCWQLLANYKAFRAGVLSILRDSKGVLIVINGATLVIGLAIGYLGLFVY